jgi:phosphoenolpyruvate carboxylase
MQVTEDGRGDELERMYTTWPFFKVTMDMIAMVLAKGDESIVSLYENKLVASDLHAVGNELRSSFATARKAVLSIVGDTSVLGTGVARTLMCCCLLYNALLLAKLKCLGRHSHEQSLNVSECFLTTKAKMLQNQASKGPFLARGTSMRCN